MLESRPRALSMPIKKETHKCELALERRQQNTDFAPLVKLTNHFVEIHSKKVMTAGLMYRSTSVSCLII